MERISSPPSQTAASQQRQETSNGEQFFQALVDNSLDALVVANPDTTIRYRNPSSARLLGYPPEHFTRHQLFEAVHPQDLHYVRQALERCLQTAGATETFETRFRHHDGSWRVLEVMARNLLHEPAVRGICIAYRDMTESKQAELDLRESESRYREVADSIPGVVFQLLIDKDGNLSIPFVSQGIRDILGVPASELLGDASRAFSLILPEDLPLVLQAIAESGQVGGAATVEFRARTPEGVVKHLWSKASGHLLPDGNMLWNNVVLDVTERKQAEEALRQSQSFASSLLDSITDLITVQDTDYSVIRMNRAAERLFAKESLGQKCYKAFRRRDSLCPDCPMARVLATGKPVHTVEQRGEHGGWVVETSAFPMKDREGQVVAVISHVKNITQRKRVQEALRERQERYRLLFERSRDALFVVDIETGRYLDANAAAERLTGRSVAELKALTVRDTAPAGADQRLRQMAAMDNSHDFDEVIYLRPDGSTRTALVSAARVNGKVVIGIARDITERKQAEAELRTSRQFVTTVLDATEDAISVINVHDYTIAAVNRAFLTTYGITQDEAIGRTCHEVTHRLQRPCAPPDHVCPLIEAVRQQRHTIVEHIHYRKDGTKTYQEVSASPIKDPGGKVVQVVHTGRDITERKGMEEALKRNMEKLQAAMEGTIRAMALTSEMRDPYTAGHQRRTTEVACAIARELGLPQDQLDGLNLAGLIHDIGKIGVPAELLSKPGQLSDLEFSLVKTHSQVGYDILKLIEFPWPIAQIVRQHHERLDGSGYPAGLRGDDILLEARILAVADTVEAMASHRPFRPAQGLERALEEIARHQGVLYDPAVVSACLKLFREKQFQLE